MTDHTNAIKEILFDICTDYIIALQLNDKRLGVEPAKQALYEAVKGCVPEEVADNIGSSTSDYEWGNRRGFNMAIEQVLTNLAELFGITKEGEEGNE